jgi:hypothetical protein
LKLLRQMSFFHYLCTDTQYWHPFLIIIGYWSAALNWCSVFIQVSAIWEDLSLTCGP